MKSIDVFAVLISYGLGCLATGYYLVRWRIRQDIRLSGSGSVGARNVGRVLGRWGFWVTLSTDILRGALAVAVCDWLETSSATAALSVPAVATGHIFPVQLDFRGGKGVAVAFGALLVLDSRIAAAWIVSFAVLYLCLRRYMSCGLLSLLPIPLFAVLFGHPPIAWASLILLVGLILLAHRHHIARLCREKSPSDNSAESAEP